MKANNRYSKKQWEEAWELKKKGYLYRDIGEKLGMNFKTVRANLNTKFKQQPIKTNSRQHIYDQVAKDRLTMTIDKVAEKWGRTKDWVSWVTCYKVKEAPGPYLRNNPKQNPEKTRITPNRPKVKPRAKNNKPKEKKEPNLPHPPPIKVQKPTRPVVINSRTTIYVKIDDKRTNEQIIKNYNKKYNL